MARSHTRPLLMQIGGRSFTWNPQSSPDGPGTLCSLVKDGQRMLRAIRAGLPENGETREQVIAAAVALGTLRGEAVCFVGAPGSAVC
jgi:hypothetical protein